ncbi:MAG: glycosyltransferase [Desulfobacterales bacterium]|nr:glycosyltransferase [Desulfobacterales bacterium]
MLFKTFFILCKERPDLLFVQNPSVILALFSVTMARLFTPLVVVDAHNEGIKPFYGRLNWLMFIYHAIQRKADLTIVTNHKLAREVYRNKGRPFVLEDKIPAFSAVERTTLAGRHNIVFICTFEKDEPYQAVIEAGRMMDPGINIYITGQYQKAPGRIIKTAPPNVVFSGFLSEQNYANLLYSCDAVVDLTLMQNCLVCGAYEAVALEKPLILSNTPALRSYFGPGAVFTENKAASIADAINHVLANKETLENQVKILKEKLQADWQEKWVDLNGVLEQLGTGR